MRLGLLRAVAKATSAQDRASCSEHQVGADIDAPNLCAPCLASCLSSALFTPLTCGAPCDTGSLSFIIEGRRVDPTAQSRCRCVPAALCHVSRLHPYRCDSVPFVRRPKLLTTHIGTTLIGTTLIGTALFGVALFGTTLIGTDWTRWHHARRLHTRRDRARRHRGTATLDATTVLATDLDATALLDTTFSSTPPPPRPSASTPSATRPRRHRRLALAAIGDSPSPPPPARNAPPPPPACDSLLCFKLCYMLCTCSLQRFPHVSRCVPRVKRMCTSVCVEHGGGRVGTGVPWTLPVEDRVWSEHVRPCVAQREACVKRGYTSPSHARRLRGISHVHFTPCAQRETRAAVKRAVKRITLCVSRYEC